MFAVDVILCFYDTENPYVGIFVCQCKNSKRGDLYKEKYHEAVALFKFMLLPVWY